MTKSYQDLIGDMTEVISQVHSRAFVMGYEYGKTEERMALAKKLADDALKETPQQARDRIVEQAKADVEDLEESEALSYRRINYVVNKEKRTIVALVKDVYFGEEVAGRGIAKCAPGDCFNVHLGRAIALRRALGLEVPSEYLNAPQPTEVRVGDIVKYPNGRIVEILEKDFFDVNRVKEVSTGDISSATTFELTKIIDDSREGVTQ